MEAAVCAEEVVEGVEADLLEVERAMENAMANAGGGLEEEEADEQHDVLLPPDRQTPHHPALGALQEVALQEHAAQEALARGLERWRCPGSGAHRRQQWRR